MGRLAVPRSVESGRIILAAVQTDIAGGVTGATLRQAIRDLNTALRDLVRAEVRFALDTHADQKTGGHDRDLLSHGEDRLDLGDLDEFFADVEHSLSHHH